MAGSINAAYFDVPLETNTSMMKSAFLIIFHIHCQQDKSEIYSIRKKSNPYVSRRENMDEMFEM
jgi:hypothetical protein